MKLSQYHKNKKLHNWIVYKGLDKMILSNMHHLIGDIYDLGCGEASYKPFLLQYATSYVGVDWSNTIHNSQADIVSDLNNKLDIKDEVADTVFSISVMEHLYNPQNFLNESYRILKKGGSIILQVPWQWWIHEAPHDYHRYTPYALKRMFEKAGYTGVDVKPTSGIFTTLTLKFNYFTLRFLKGPRILKLILKLFLVPIWTILQLLAPLLDKLDRKWEMESQGYFVIAKKSQ